MNWLCLVPGRINGVQGKLEKMLFADRNGGHLFIFCEENVRRERSDSRAGGLRALFFEDDLSLFGSGFLLAIGAGYIAERHGLGDGAELP
jgi:hypothetical protein